MASFTPGRLVAALLVTVAVAPAGAAIVQAAYGPKVVTRTEYRDKIVYKNPDGSCMNTNELGTVVKVTAVQYSQATKEQPEAYSITTSVTFRMMDGSSRICQWVFADLAENFPTGHRMAVVGGKRVA